MKKVFGIVALVLFVSVLFVACTPHKQACAAYDQVELEQE